MFEKIKLPNKSMKNGWKSQYFRSNFILILLVVSIPGIVSGIGLYWFGVGQVEEELTESHEKQIKDKAENIDDQLEYLEVSLSYWAFDPRFNYSLVELDFIKEFQETRDISKKLMIIQGSNPLIEKVELYLNTDKPILLNPNYSLIEDQMKQAFYQSILTNNKTVSWNKFTNQGNEDNSEKLALSHNIPGVSRPPFGSIIITIDNTKLIQLMETLIPYNEGATFLLNENEEVLISSTTNKNDAFISQVKEMTINQEEATGSFSFDWEQETYSVSYGTMHRIRDNWTYVSVAPISSITSPIVFISKLILVISFSGLILGFIMSWFASTRIYTPIRKLLHVFVEDEQSLPFQNNKDEFEIIKENWTKVTNESQKLQKQLSAQIPQLKQSFLLQLRKGYLYNYSELELRSRMQSYGWQLNHQQFLLVDVQLTGVFESEKVLKDNDESLVTFTLENILEEYAKDYFEQFTVVNYHDLSVGLLIVTPQESKLKMRLNHFAEGATSIINRILELKVTVTISESIDKVKQIPHLFEKVSYGKRYRTFENKNQIINLTEWNGEDNDHKFFYPFETEKEIIQAIRRGKVLESEQLIRQFINELKETDIHEINIQPGIIQLFSMIQHEIIHSGIHPNELFEGKNMIEELSDIRELEWIVKWMVEKVVTPYVELLEGRMDVEMKRLVEHVVAYIDQHYMLDTSLEECAEMVNTNPYTLSKSFKKVLNINFIDYLTNVRIDKAKELLLNTNMKIADISESVGYRHSYFNRIFKKQVGVPPSQYRKMESSG
ncbi:AraC family transcriptional regulator [Aquibacillus rhizosphaerae]|uniref:AraC family transcriptional regulator n=1 Tax=Aquibacillus rhizosphaerae TaxID=3051431 RepID=A0ABT7L8V3_9BACI|nr:AraC family transcriptional regulator [Aquibacillus sp. LR5S19]MDL4842308.1 AraC family transcriptional regulator [Aquibacillus sp. LR5S19]